MITNINLSGLAKRGVLIGSWFLISLCIAPMAEAKSLAEVQYRQYQEPNLDKAYIKPADISPTIARLKKYPLLSVEVIGQSFEGRNIHQIKIGHGTQNVLIWSQMHGDEPTATASIFDVINYIVADEQSHWRDTWTSRLTLTFVPMLNPDGSHAVSRFNKQGIDINRDANKRQTPEGALLMSLAKQLKPSYGFNLHDQGRYYRVSGSQNPATISVLSPSYNTSREINSVRADAMKLIVEMNSKVNGRLNGHIGRYDDAFSNRAFGDTLTAMGVRTVLIEAGGFKGDDNRQVARKAIYQMLIAGIDAISTRAYQARKVEAYLAIPENDEGGYQDLIVRNLQVKPEDNAFHVDLVVDLDVYGGGLATIKEIGDAKALSAYHEFDASSFTFVNGNAYTLSQTETMILTDSSYFRLLKKGISHFVGDASKINVKTKFPVTIVNEPLSCTMPCLGDSATFLLTDGRGIKFAVIDGQVIDLRIGKVLNGKST